MDAKIESVVGGQPMPGPGDLDDAEIIVATPGKEGREAGGEVQSA